LTPDIVNINIPIDLSTRVDAITQWNVKFAGPGRVGQAEGGEMSRK
jgi:hypothetical protein